jgi:6-phosphofructo-2-kinase
MPHSTLWQAAPFAQPDDNQSSSSAALTTASAAALNHHHHHNNNNLPPTPAQSPVLHPLVDPKSENIHNAGRCSCVQEDTTPLGHYRRRQSQQSNLAKFAMTSSTKVNEEMRRSNSAEGIAHSDKEVEQLRSDLDRALSPEIEKNAMLGEDQEQKPANLSTDTITIKGRPVPVVAKGSAMSKALAGQYPEGSGSGVTYAANDTPATTAPNTAPSSPRMYGTSPPPGYGGLGANPYLSPPIRQLSGMSTPRPRPTTLDIPGLTKSKVSPDGRIAQRDVGAKLVIVMVGLPARGKSYITKKLARYLNWLQHDTRIFNVGERRRVAAGGPNTLEKTTSKQSNASGNQDRRPSMAPGRHGSIVDQSELAKTISNENKPVSVAQIILNDGTKIEPPTPSKSAVDNQTNGQTMKKEEMDPEDQDMEELEKKFPELMEAQQNAQGDSEALPANEHMDQSASFFDPKNTKAALIREQLAMDTLDELLDYILDQNGAVGILDATNSTLERRKMVVRHIRERAGFDLNVLFLESRCVDTDLLESNMRLKLSGPDYKDMDPNVALADFKKRIAVYETAYLPLGDYEEHNNVPYIQMIDVGRKIISHQIRGFLMAQANYYLLNFNLAPRQIWITRHGLSLDNISGKIGGDSDLSPEGVRYASSLARFMDYQRGVWEQRQQAAAANTHFPPQSGDATPPNPHYSPRSPNPPTLAPTSAPGNVTPGGYELKPFCVWTSMLKRSIQTAQFFNDEDYDQKQMRMLDELNAGVMEGLTYNCISTQHPKEYASRKKDKLHYRYPGPGGEGYLDVINRLRPVIVELERMTDHVLLVGHRSVARVLLAYFRGLDREEVADLDVPIGMLYCLEPKPYGVDFKAFQWDKESEWFHEVPDFQLRRAQDDMK